MAPTSITITTADTLIGSRTVFANGASLAGHVVVEDDAIMGAFAAVRQFCRVGRHAFVGAFAPLNKDVLPFLWTSADRPTKAWKVNSVGLSRKGYSAERVAALQKAYRLLHRHRHDQKALLTALADATWQPGPPRVEAEHGYGRRTGVPSSHSDPSA